MDYDLLGQKIKRERLRAGLSQDQLAEAADISTGFLGHIESGRRKLSIETLVRLASKLNVSTDYLLSDSIEHESGIYYGELRTQLKNMDKAEVDKIADIVRKIVDFADDK